MHRLHLHRSAIIKVEDCLAETPIDLPPESALISEDAAIKREPQPPEGTARGLQIIENNGDSVLLHLHEGGEANHLEQMQEKESTGSIKKRVDDRVEVEINIPGHKTNSIK